MSDNFYEITNKPYTATQLQNKYKYMRTTWIVWRDLGENSGFGWDETNKLYISTDAVWNSYIISHPKAAQFRRKTLFRADDLNILFR